MGIGRGRAHGKPRWLARAVAKDMEGSEGFMACGGSQPPGWPVRCSRPRRGQGAFEVGLRWAQSLPQAGGQGDGQGDGQGGGQGGGQGMAGASRGMCRGGQGDGQGDGRSAEGCGAAHTVSRRKEIWINI